MALIALRSFSNSVLEYPRDNGINNNNSNLGIDNATTVPTSPRESRIRLVRRRFFCSEFVSAALKDLGVMNRNAVVDGHLQPGDFASDYTDMPLNHLLDDDWQFAGLVFIVDSIGKSTKGSGEEQTGSTKTPEGEASKESAGCGYGGR